MKKKIHNLFKSTIAVAIISFISFINVQAQTTKGEAVVSTVTATATVTKINHKTREVHIKTEDGMKYRFVVSTDVQNLAQVDKGDVVTVVYTEAIAYEIKKSGSTGATTGTAAATANPGEKPAGAVAQQTTITVKIIAIDTTAPSVTVKGSNGDVETIKVKYPEKLKGVKVGDMVDLTYTEAIAIKVDERTKK